MTASPDDATVVDATTESRLVVRQGGAEAELIYRVEGNRLVVVHTGVPDELAGRGIGSRLVRAALAKAQADHLIVVPWCPFARHWLREHPDQVAGLTVDWDSERPT
jgi:uncharacterized protein